MIRGNRIEIISSKNMEFIPEEFDLCDLCVNYNGTEIADCLHNHIVDIHSMVDDQNEIVKYFVDYCTGYEKDWVKVIKKGRIRRSNNE